MFRKTWMFLAVLFSVISVSSACSALRAVLEKKAFDYFDLSGSECFDAANKTYFISKSAGSALTRCGRLTKSTASVKDVVMVETYLSGSRWSCRKYLRSNCDTMQDCKIRWFLSSQGEWNSSCVLPQKKLVVNVSIAGDQMCQNAELTIGHELTLTNCFNSSLPSHLTGPMHCFKKIEDLDGYNLIFSNQSAYYPVIISKDFSEVTISTCPFDFSEVTISTCPFDCPAGKIQHKFDFRVNSQKAIRITREKEQSQNDPSPTPNYFHHECPYLHQLDLSSGRFMCLLDDHLILAILLGLIILLSAAILAFNIFPFFSVSSRTAHLAIARFYLRQAQHQLESKKSFKVKN